MLEAGFPEGVLQNLILKTEDIVNVINDERVQGASVTGSVRAGSAVASEAGAVIKKTVMELGGSDAFIVLEDADIPKAVAAGITGRFKNAGQICLAAKRFILVGKIADEFEEQFVKAAQAIRVGDPMDPANQMGPMARADLRDSLHKQVEGSIAAGARVLCGGKPKEGKGAFYMPTVLSGVTQGMPAFDDETFGPVAAITRVPDVDAAVDAANASQFGLSGNVWTRDVALARKMARDLYTGGVFINGVTASDPRVPVGRRQEQWVRPRALAFWRACFCECPNCLDRELLMRAVSAGFRARRKSEASVRLRLRTARSHGRTVACTGASSSALDRSAAAEHDCLSAQ